MDKFLCPDDQHPSESSGKHRISSTNSLVHKYELNMRNYILMSDDVISAFAAWHVHTRQVYIVSNVSDIMMMSSRIT